MTTPEVFINRLKKVGIEVELYGNLPWIYLYKVNGRLVKNRYYSKYGFTVFIGTKKPIIVDVGKVFREIRRVLEEDIIQKTSKAFEWWYKLAYEDRLRLYKRYTNSNDIASAKAEEIEHIYNEFTTHLNS